MIQMVKLTMDRSTKMMAAYCSTSPQPTGPSLFLDMGERDARATPVLELYTSPTTVDIMTPGYSLITSRGVDSGAKEAFVPV